MGHTRNAIDNARIRDTEKNDLRNKDAEKGVGRLHYLTEWSEIPDRRLQLAADSLYKTTWR
jgi:hypothetical protein